MCWVGVDVGAGVVVGASVVGVCVVVDEHVNVDPINEYCNCCCIGLSHPNEGITVKGRFTLIFTGPITAKRHFFDSRKSRLTTLRHFFDSRKNRSTSLRHFFDSRKTRSTSLRQFFDSRKNRSTSLRLMPFGNYLPAQFFDLQAQRAADSSAQPIGLGSDSENRYAA